MVMPGFRFMSSYGVAVLIVLLMLVAMPMAVVVLTHAPARSLPRPAQPLRYWRTEKPVNTVIAGALPVTPK